jgi:Leucine rich repeat
LIIYEPSNSADVACVIPVSSWNWASSVGNTKTCIITADIEAAGTKISTAKDDLTTGLRIFENRKVTHLPENVVEKFPKLKGYAAISCSVKEISQLNFKGLNLTVLNLRDNQIEKIAIDTFKDLVNLEFLNLCKSTKIMNFSAAKKFLIVLKIFQFIIF